MNELKLFNKKAHKNKTCNVFIFKMKISSLFPQKSPCSYNCIAELQLLCFSYKKNLLLFLPLLCFNNWKIDFHYISAWNMTMVLAEFSFLAPAIIFQGDWIPLQATFNNFHMGFEWPPGNAMQNLGSPFMSKAWVRTYKLDNSKTILILESYTE